MNNQKIINSIAYSLYADSLALPVHWIYDQNKIKNQYQDFYQLHSVKENIYHPEKTLGEHTHYGDQALLLLNFVQNHETFKIEDFKENWINFIKDYSGYFDGASRRTLENFNKGLNVGSNSEDLGGASRTAGLLFLYNDNLNELIEFAKLQTKLTHDNPITINISEFLIRTVISLIEGETLEISINIAAKAINDPFIDKSIYDAKSKQELEASDAILELGQACSAVGGLASSLFLIYKYQNNIKEALNQNCLAGGDSAARGLLVGMILGAITEDLNPEIIKMKSFKQIRF